LWAFGPPLGVSRSGTARMLDDPGMKGPSHSNSFDIVGLTR
jgi:hypothetical protein